MSVLYCLLWWKSIQLPVMEEVTSMSPTDTDVRKRCEKCLEYVNVHLTCFKCDAVYHIYCLKKVPGVYVNQRGHLLCCRGLPSKYARAYKNLGTPDNPLGKVIEKGSEDGYREVLENCLPEEEISTQNEFKCVACFLKYGNKIHLENHYRECHIKQEGSIPALNKDKAGLAFSSHNKDGVQKESSEQPIKRCDVESSYFRLNEGNDNCVTTTKSDPTQGDDQEEKYTVTVSNYSTYAEESVVKHMCIDDNEMSFKCDICEYTAKEGETLKKHISSKHYDGKEKMYDSKVCAFSTSPEDTFGRHLPIHNNETSFKCDWCDYSAALRTTLKVHIKTKHSNAEEKYKYTDCYKNASLVEHDCVHTKERPFKCDMCDYATSWKSGLNRHVLTQHRDTEKKYKCADCEYSTHDKSILVKHRRVHTKERPFRCDTCGFTTAWGNVLKTHVLAKHSNAEKKYKCADCKYSTNNKTSLANHERVHTKERPFKCDMCDYGAALMSNLKIHVLRKHSNAEKKYKCTDCEFSAHKKAGLVQHNRVHTKEKPFKCDTCGFTTAWKGMLKAHILTKHSNVEQKYKCTDCEFSTYNMASLVQHNRIHTKERPFKCDTCDYAANQKCALNLHILKKHSNAEKKYKCTDCEFSAHEKVALVIHQRVHTKERPFKCDSCDYAATQKSALNGHILRKHSNAEKRYKCADCEFSAYMKERLETHKRIHTKEKPFKCDMCDFTTGWKNALKIHTLTKHSSAEKQTKCVHNIPLILNLN